MDEDKRVDCPIGYQLGSHYGFAERGRCTQDAFVMPQRLAYGLGLFIAETSLVYRINGLALAVAFVANAHSDAMLLQQFAHLLQAASW